MLQPLYPRVTGDERRNHYGTISHCATVIEWPNDHDGERKGSLHRVSIVGCHGDSPLSTVRRTAIGMMKGRRFLLIWYEKGSGHRDKAVLLTVLDATWIDEFDIISRFSRLRVSCEHRLDTHKRRPLRTTAPVASVSQRPSSGEDRACAEVRGQEELPSTALCFFPA